MLLRDRRFSLPFIKVIPFTGKVKVEGDLSLLVLSHVAMQGIGRIHLYLEFKSETVQDQRQSQPVAKTQEAKPIDAMVIVKDNNMGTTIRLFEWFNRKKGKTLDAIYKSNFNL